MGIFYPKNTTKIEFLDSFGGIFEHSPQFTEKVFDDGFDKDEYSIQELHSLFCQQFQNVEDAERLIVLKAHPSLAGKLALAGELTEESTSEQASAGLDALSKIDLEQFQSLNEKYETKFEFPFIIAVKGLNAKTILENFKNRVHNEYGAEFEEACRQVEKIALLRLTQILE